MLRRPDSGLCGSSWHTCLRNKLQTSMPAPDLQWKKSVSVFPLLGSYKNVCTLLVKIARLYVLFADVQLGMNVFKYLKLSAHSVASWQGMLNWRNRAWLWWPEELWLMKNWTQVEMHVTHMLEEHRWGNVSCLKYSMYLKICLKHFLPSPHQFSIYKHPLIFNTK